MTNAEPDALEGLARLRGDGPRALPHPRVLRGEQRDKSLKLGKELLEKEMHSASLARLVKHDEELRKVCEQFGRVDGELWVNIGYGKIRRADHRLPRAEGRRRARLRASPPILKEGRIESIVRKVTGKDNQGIVLNGIDDVLVRYTKCCNPLPGDEIVGFITRGRGVTVHRRNCTKAFDADPDRRVEIRGTRGEDQPPGAGARHDAESPGILATVGQTFHEQGINISEAQLPSRRRRPREQHVHVPVLRPQRSSRA
jgi:guanosine-3',5'-bis(diphosphate) 3'-pyrophosphohydrolase